MKLIKTVDEFINWRNQQSASIGFIPTLGALHNGHLSLIRASKKQCKITAVSIFLNPTQFAANEDLSLYPNTLEQDLESLRELKVDVLFFPNQQEMYQKTGAVNIPASELFKKLEGKSRPHFFYGVTTIVAKLFNIIKPSHAFFGEKDAQQLYIIGEMINKMNYQIILIPCPIIRDQNGLALSSRNQYLTKSEQKKASIVYQGLMHIKNHLNRGETNPKILKKIFIKIIGETPELRIDYISIACIYTLEEIDKINGEKLLISTAVFLRDVRLIDNFTYLSSDI